MSRVPESHHPGSRHPGSREARTHMSPSPWGEPPPGYRLPPGARPGPIRLQVSEVERSREWYEAVLGFTGRVLADGGLALAPAGGPPLVELRERPGATPAPPGGRPGLYHFALLLPDRGSLGRFVAHLQELGTGRRPTPPVGRVGSADHAVSEALYLRDPDGLGVEVYADRPKEEWRWRGRELIMGTEPLDLADLLRSGGDGAWKGLPSGTVMGHLHLHVADLPTAEIFYHRGVGLDRVVWSYPGALFLSAGGYHHHLGVNAWARTSRPPEEGDAQLLEWSLELPSPADVDGARESLEALDLPVEELQEGGLRIRDPWGTALRLFPSPGEAIP